MKPGKGILLLMGGKPKKDVDEEKSDEGVTEETEEVKLEDIAKDLISAVKEGDESAVAEALRAAVACIQDYETEEEDEE